MLPMPPGDTGTAHLDGTPVLVTGATGFIGGHVVALLHRLGAEVHAIHRRPDPSTSFDTPVTWHRADLVDAEATMAAVGAAGPEHIVHLASLVKGARDPQLLHPMFEANVTSTVNILDGARRHGVRRVQLAGSLEEPDAGQAPASPYALSKDVAHRYGDYYRDQAGVEVVNLQIFMVYGPATPDGNKLVPYVIRNLLEGRAPELSSGDRQVDWVHVGDVAEGIVRCALVGEAPRSPVPLGTGHLHTVRQVVESLVELIGIDVEPRFGSLTDRRQEVVRAADTALTRELLAWAPGIGLGEGLAATVAWHRGESDGRPDGLAAVEGAAR